MAINSDVKDSLQAKRIYYWELSDKLHVSEMTLCRWLRHELPEEKKKLILNAITEIIVERTKF